MTDRTEQQYRKEKTIRLRIDSFLLDKLNTHVQGKGTDMSKVIRQLLQSYLD